MIPKKAFAPLGFSLAAFLVLGVALAGPSSHVLAEDTPTNYTKTITITPSMIPYTNTHTEATIVIQGLPVTIGQGVYASGSWIVLDLTNASGIKFPSFKTKSGAHGTGYQSLTFGPAPASGYSMDVGCVSYKAGDSVNFTSATKTLSSTATTVFTLNTAFPDTPLARTLYTGSKSTRIAYLLVSYGCVSA